MPFWKNLRAHVETKADAYEPSTRYIGSAGRATPKDFGEGRVAITEGYEACTWVYRCVRRKQNMVASVPWIVRTTDSDGTIEEDRLHPAATRLNNPATVYDRWYMFHRSAGFLSVVGNAFLGMAGAGSEDEDPTQWLANPAGEFRVESPIGVTPISDGLGWIEEYEVIGESGKNDPWDPATVIHVMLPSLSTPFWGMSELQAMAGTIDTDVAAHRWNLDSFGSGGMPTTLMIDNTLSPGGLKKGKQDIEDRFRRTGRSRVPWLIPGAAIGADKAAIELHKLGMTPQEMDWLAGAGFTRDEIFVGLGFHPADASNERATHDNARVAQKQAWTGAAMPLLQAFSSWFSLRLLTRAERESGMAVVPDLSGVDELRDSRDAMAEAFKNLTDGGLSVVDAAKTVNLDISDLPEYKVPTNRSVRQADQPPPQ